MNNHSVSTHWVTVITSLLALFAALSGMFNGRCTMRGMVAKNEAILKQNLASDLWSYYQAKNTRGDIFQVASLSLPRNSKKFKEFSVKIEEVEVLKKDLFQKAKTAELERDQMTAKSDHFLECTRYFASALGLLQLAVILAPLTLIVQRRRVLVLSSVIGSFGFIYFLLGCYHYIR